MFCFVLFLFFLSLFVCLLVGFVGAKGWGWGAWSKENIFLTKVAHLKLSFNQQFRYMTCMSQQHMKDFFCFVFASMELKRGRFCEADTQCKFKCLLKAG